MNEAFGRFLSWSMLLLVLLTLLVALLRYGFAVGWVWMQDGYLWLFGASFMLGAGYTLLHDAHVRVDFIYVARGPRYRAVIDLAGSLLFLLPMTAAIFWLSFPYAYDSWARLEGALDAGGLQPVYLIKSVLLVSCIPLGAQGIALAIRSYLTLTAGPAASSEKPADEGSPFHV